MNQLEEKIKATLSDFLKYANENVDEHSNNNRRWTRGVLERLAHLGDAEDYWVCGGGHDKEWLYDLVWYKTGEEDKLKSIGLVVESEWGDLSDVKFDFEKLLVANCKMKLMICWTARTEDIAPAGTFDFNALHVFRDNTFIAVGTTGQAEFYTGSAWVNQSPTGYGIAAFKDVYWHDDRTGFLAGDSVNTGVLLKCISPVNVQTLSAGGLTWNRETLKDGVNITANSQANLNVVAFADRYHGLVGGKYATGFTNTTNYPYVRLLHDEADMFSTFYYYNSLGRIVAFQNTKQFNKTPAAYGYTLYDALGRVIEVGEKAENTSGHKFKNIFGDTVNNFFNPRVVNNDSLSAWIADTSGHRKEVVHTYYDTIQYAGLPVTQQNLRNRISTTTFEDVNDNNRLTYNFATHMSYDVSGNLSTVLQDDSNNVAGQRFKRIDYEYDLVSDKMNVIRYQEGKPDVFYHFYDYDADNRVTKVYTSKHDQSGSIINGNTVMASPFWDNDAHYFYYAHGPLARIEVGDNQVQGIDYAYTLQGWVKAVNSTLLKSRNDIGHDGNTSGADTINRGFARDAFSYSLNYFNHDYKPIGSIASTDSAIATIAHSDLLKARHDLFSGNISSMVTTISKPTVYTADTSKKPTVLPQGTAYRYDQLHRIVEMQAYQNIVADSNLWAHGSTYAGMYNNKYTYDANGNILTAMANNQAGQGIDKEVYNYQTIGGNRINNHLYAINDTAAHTSGNDILSGQAAYDNTAATINTANNYGYSEIGELTRDNQDSIANITWTVYGKIKSVTRVTGCIKPDFVFNYDANGNRVSKVVKPRDHSGVLSSSNWITIYYVRNASGSIMSVYTDKPGSGSFAQTERPIYGTGEIGVETTSLEMIGASLPTDTFTRYLGFKHYSGSNHLGNVLAVVTDKKIPRKVNPADTIIDHFEPEVIAANDYAPFGGLLTERTFNRNTFPNSFNGKRDDADLSEWQDYGARMYMVWGRRFPTVDPIFKKYPEYTPYQFSSNSPIENIDLDGLEKYTIHYQVENGKKTFLYKETDNSLKYRRITLFGILPLKPARVEFITHEKDDKGVQTTTSTGEIKLKNFFNTLYVGPFNPKNQKGEDRTDLPPINLLDAKALTHDIGYGEKGASGGSDAYANTAVIPEDKQLIQGALDVVKAQANKTVDPYTGDPVSKSTASAAQKVVNLFDKFLTHKEKTVNEERKQEQEKQNVPTDIVEKESGGGGTGTSNKQSP